MKYISKALTIAGSDASGGAGLEADLKVFTEYGLFGLAAVTTIVTMDPEDNWKHKVTTIPVDIVRDQLTTALSSDNQINAIKTGMIGSVEIVNLIKETIIKYNLKNIVIDPVLACKGEDELLNPETADAIKRELLPLATFSTPNLVEAGIFSGMGKLNTMEEIKEAAKKIYELGSKHVVITFGKNDNWNNATDIYYDGSVFHYLEGEKFTPSYNHGAGCTFSAAIAAGLASGLTPRESAFKAKDFITYSVKYGFKFNNFVGPVYHSAYRLCK